jgi:hypothetical protein
MANLVAHGLHQRTLGGLIETHETGNTAHRKPEMNGYSLEFSTRQGVEYPVPRHIMGVEA